MNQPSTLTELSSTDEFMARLAEALAEAPAMHDSVTFSVTTLHRDMEDSASTCLALYVNEDDGVCITSKLTTDQVLELIDVIALNPEAKLPQFGVRVLKNELMAVFNGECDPGEQSFEVAKYINDQAAYQGVLTEVIMSLEPISKYSITLNVDAEYFLDTTEADRAVLRERDIDHIHEPTVQNHRERIVTLGVVSMEA